jgi:hypothetical protein
LRLCGENNVSGHARAIRLMNYPRAVQPDDPTA